MGELSNLVVLTAPTMADISAPSTVYVASPSTGTLYRAFSCLQGGISGADCTWTVTINGVAASGTGTVTASGSAAGTVDMVEYSLMNPPLVNKGDVLGFVSAGESSTTAPAHFSAVIRT